MPFPADARRGPRSVSDTTGAPRASPARDEATPDTTAPATARACAAGHTTGTSTAASTSNHRSAKPGPPREARAAATAPSPALGNHTGQPP
ncbi:hypothetical protein [Streptomyces sp. NPDC058045]|uniref:hypothetical protein n=1 Tax=Streptomyces sp. NPDC058045 TaxID=3346311 RepID=UPI0036E65B3E